MFQYKIAAFQIEYIHFIKKIFFNLPNLKKSNKNNFFLRTQFILQSENIKSSSHFDEITTRTGKMSFFE